MLEHCRHDVRPGLSGYAQVHGRNAISWDDKFELDIEYVNKITFIGDVQIVFQTVFKSFVKQEGISSATSETMEDFVEYVNSKDSKLIKWEGK